jgi:hypothetical protein
VISLACPTGQVDDAVRAAALRCQGQGRCMVNRPGPEPRHLLNDARTKAETWNGSLGRRLRRWSAMRCASTPKILASQHSCISDQPTGLVHLLAQKSHSRPSDARLRWFSKVPEGPGSPLWCEARTPFACVNSASWAGSGRVAAALPVPGWLGEGHGRSPPVAVVW